MKENRKVLTVCYVRHGQTYDNVNQIMVGHKPGKLTEIGIKQAHQTGIALKDAQFHKIYVSDLGRTKETYQGIISKATQLANVNTQFISLIRERAVGVLQGKKYSAWHEGAQKQNKNIRQFTCDGGESWQDVFDRCHQFLHHLIKTHLVPNQCQREIVPNPTKILVVSHGGFIMETLNLVNLITENKSPLYQNNAKNCSFHEFQISYKGTQFQNINDSEILIKTIKQNLTHY